MKDLTNRKAKVILDMLARKAGGYEFTVFALDPLCNYPARPSVNYHDVHLPAETDTRFLTKNNLCFIDINKRACTYDLVLKKLLEIAAKYDITVNTMSNPVFMRKNTTLEELIVQADLEV